MTRFALAVVLALSVPYFASAQHHSEGGSRPSSSGSSASSSSGSSGGYSGGSSHSSGSSGSGGYSGGSSHSSSSSSSGGSHSSGAASSSHSGGASSGSTSSSARSGGYSSNSPSSTYSPSSGSSGNARNGSRDNSLHSNIRISTTRDIPISNAAPSGSSPGSGMSGITMRSLPTRGLPGSGRPDSIQDEAWMHQQFQIQLPQGSVDKKFLAHTVTEQGREVGIEPNKSAYKEKLASLGGPESRHVSWVGKLFGEKPKPIKGTPVSELRACKGEECGKNPPPKPCVGPKCPKPGPPPKPQPPAVGHLCYNGYSNTGGTCQPWGYFRDCTYNRSYYGGYNVPGSPWGYCRVQWASVNSSYCSRILQEIQHQKMVLQQTGVSQGTACSTGPQSPGCSKVTQQLNDAQARIQQLQQQYQICTAAAGVRGSPSASGPWSLNPWPSVVWP